MPEQSQERPYHHGDVRAALMEAAERSLRERGAAQLSLRDLAREIGVSHGAPRRHFKERQDLLDALAENGFHRLGDLIRQADTDNGGEFAIRVRNATGAFARFAVENPALLELMNATKHQPGKSAVTRAAESAFSPLVGLIKAGQAREIVQAGSVEEMGLILYATINGLVALINSGLVDSTRLDALMDTAVNQFLKGVAPE